MSKFFIDCEFIEGKQDKTFLGFKYGETKPTIDLISIALVSEDGREYYAISKDFNLKEAWNRYDLESMSSKGGIGDSRHKKVYWIRENILYPIFAELFQKHNPEIWAEEYGNIRNFIGYFERYGNGMKRFKELLEIYGKTNKEIAEEIVQFIDARWIEEGNISKGFMYPGETSIKEVKTKNVQFYGYYSDYDWVTFCWLFGKMMDLPKGFPMFAFDIQQQITEHSISKEQLLKEVPQINIHNSLNDARWNYNVYKWIQNKINTNA